MLFTEQGMLSLYVYFGPEDLVLIGLDILGLKTTFLQPWQFFCKRQAAGPIGIARESN